MKSAFAKSREADARTVFDSSGNFRVNRSLAQNPAFTFALWARIGDYASRTLAGGTRARNTEEPLLVANLSPARARAAGYRSFAGSRP